MREAARGVAFVVGTNWRVARAPFAVAAVLTGLLACVPALQVFVIAELVTALGADSTTMRDVLVPLLAVALIIGLNGPVRAAVEVLRQQADDVGAATTTAALTRRAARTSPRDLARPEVVAELERHAESIWQVVNAIPVLTFWAAQHVISTIGVIVAVAVFSPLAALLTAISLIPALLGGRWLAQRLEAFWDRVGKLFARERYLTNLLVRQRSAAELAVLGAGTGVARQAGDYWLRYIAERRRLRGAQLRIEWLVGTVATLSVLGALVALLLDVDLSPTAVAGVTGVIAAAGSVAAAGSDLGSLLSFGPQAAKLRDFLGRAPKTVERATSVPVTKVDEIRLAEMSHTYPDRDAPALVDVSFEARRGEMIALVGANGAGKTTAVRALLGLIEPDNGLVEADGVRPADVGDRAWLDRFGVLVQEYERYELTVRQNLLLGNDDEIGDEQLWHALELAGLAQLVRALPDGLEAQLGEQWDGTQLSGGQWQRLALARVVVRDAPVWVLDEPTSAVDAESEEAILDRLRSEGADRITVLVSHRAWTLRAVDRIYVLDEGHVVEHGTYAELLDRPGSRFAELFRNQLGPTTHRGR